MRRKFSFFFIFFFSALSSLYASGLTEKVERVYREAKEFRADFVQKTKIEILDRQVEERGKLTFTKPGKFVIHYQGNRERKYVSDGKKLTIYYPQEKEVEAYHDLKGMISKEGLIFLDGLGEMTKIFQVTEKKPQSLVLIPRDPKTSFKRIVLEIDPQSYWVKEVILYPKSGNTTHYWFSKVEVSQ